MSLNAPDENTRADVVLATMAVIFLGLAIFFFASSAIDSFDGKVNTRGNDIYRSQSPELFAHVVKRTIRFGVAMTAVAALCAIGSRLLKPKV